MLMPHHYQVNSHWFSHAAHYNPLNRQPLAMYKRLRPNNASLPGHHSRSWRWPRATLANFGVAQKLSPEMLSMLQLPLLQTRAALWLGGPSKLAERNIKHEAAAAGHDVGRVLFSPRVSSSEYVERATRATL